MANSTLIPTNVSQVDTNHILGFPKTSHLVQHGENAVWLTAFFDEKIKG